GRPSRDAETPVCDMRHRNRRPGRKYAVRAAKATQFAAAGPPPTIFLSFSQGTLSPVAEATYALRTVGDPLGTVNAVRDLVARADPRVPVTRVKTQRALIEGTINQEITFA